MQDKKDRHDFNGSREWKIPGRINLTHRIKKLGIRERASLYRTKPKDRIIQYNEDIWDSKGSSGQSELISTKLTGLDKITRTERIRQKQEDRHDETRPRGQTKLKKYHQSLNRFPGAIQQTIERINRTDNFVNDQQDRQD
jgi:hypothetical protein